MTHRMWAAVVHEFGRPLRIEEVDVPEVRPGRISLQLGFWASATPICMRPRETGR